jgi:PAS domain S-box-containing protein
MSTIVDPRPLYQVQRRLEAVLNNATVSIFLMDEKQQCIYMNAAAEELTGYRLDEVLPLDKPLHDIIHHTHPDGRPFPMADCAIDRAFPEHAKTQGREIFVHKDGSFYPVAFSASPIRDESSLTIGTVIEARNIADEIEREEALREASKANRLLLQEVNHRVKNSLQLVMSLLDLQAGETQDARAAACLKDAKNRVRVIASIHGRLYESQQYDTVEICSYLRQLVESTLASTGQHGIALRFEGCSAIVLPISSAVSLALIVSELVVNAAKHAFQQSTGTLTVKLTSDEEALAIEVCDDGRGMPPGFAMERGGSLGMTLILALAMQIGARISHRNGSPGTVFRLDLKI